MSVRAFGKWLLGLLVVATGTSEVHAQRYTQLCSFGSRESTGVELSSKLIEGRDGALYGTTRLTFEGVSSISLAHGVVYKVNKDGTGYQVLKIFGTQPDDGALLSGGVSQTRDGRLIGVTQSGGSYHLAAGTLYILNADGSEFRYLYNFSSNGYQPQGPPIEGSDGAIYGTTRFGLPPDLYLNSEPQGTVWRINSDGTGFTTLHYFASAYTGGGNGSEPAGRLIEAADGWLYGTTEEGGLAGLGTIYRLSKDGSAFEIIKHFGTAAGENYSPLLGVIENVDGVLYGIAIDPVNPQSPTFGIRTNYVYRVDRDGSNFAILRSFGPEAGALQDLIVGSDHFLYVTYSAGVIRLPAPGVNQFILQGVPGGLLGVTEASDGALYMAVRQGGARRFGSILKVNKDGTSSSVVREFQSSRPDGANHLKIIDGGDGFLYGSSQEGGLQNFGTVWRVSRDGGDPRVLHQFLGVTNGFRPSGALLLASDGLLYGLTGYGGANGVSGSGVLFRLSREGTGFEVVHHFAHAHLQLSELMEGTDGSLYGGAWYDDSGRNAPFYKINKDGTGFRILHSFETTSQYLSLTPARDGTWYGTYGAFDVFRFDSASDSYQTIVHFPYADGAHYPLTILEGQDGLLYGGGVRNGRGTVYRMQPDGGGFTLLWSEDYPRIRPDVVEGPDGLLYFTQPESGPFEGIGSLWRMLKDGSASTEVHHFPTGDGDGVTPKYVMKATNGAIYGVTLNGGLANGGTVFRLDWPLLAPSNLVAVARSSTQVNLSWINVEPRATAVRIERRVVPETTWSEIAIVTSGTNSFSDDTVAPGQSITYRARASNAQENSEYSNEALVMTPPQEFQVNLVSVAAEDGFVVERHRTANVGGVAIAGGWGPSGLYAGDTAGNQQVKAIVSFRTGSLPQGATVLAAKLKLKRGFLYGNPFDALGACNVDMDGPAGFSGSLRLQPEDFQDAALLQRVATIAPKADASGWHTAVLNESALKQIARGNCQLRIYFARGDDGDFRYDLVGWHSGDALRPENRPVLEVVYR